MRKTDNTGFYMFLACVYHHYSLHSLPVYTVICIFHSLKSFRILCISIACISHFGVDFRYFGAFGAFGDKETLDSFGASEVWQHLKTFRWTKFGFPYTIGKLEESRFTWDKNQRNPFSRLEVIS